MRELFLLETKVYDRKWQREYTLLYNRGLYTHTPPPLTCTPCQRDEPQAQRSHQASLHPAHHLRIITGAGSNPAAEGSPLKDHHHCSSKIPTQKMPTAERGQITTYSVRLQSKKQIQGSKSTPNPSTIIFQANLQLHGFRLDRNWNSPCSSLFIRHYAGIQHEKKRK